MSVGISLIVIKIESGRLPQSLHSFAMTIYLFLNFDGIVSANNSVVAQKHSQRAFEEFFAHIEALLNLLGRAVVRECKRAAFLYAFSVNSPIAAISMAG